MQANLPIFAIEADFRRAIAEKPSLLLTSPTGSGKSTQIPKFAAEELSGKILVLQPRRLAARMLAERVAFEQGETVGKTIGYLTRYERAVSEKNRILFLTEGILTRMLIADPKLPGISCLIFDEFHERSIHTDLGLSMARQIQRSLRPDLKILVMSATMDPAPVQQFLGGEENCPLFQSDGKKYPVEIRYSNQPMPQADIPSAAAKALQSLLQQQAQGDVLIFLPGGREIRHTIQECEKLHWEEPLVFLPLYGDLPPEEQKRVMKPGLHRKIIVATNIAETSLTIPGVRHVIDSGLARVARYDVMRGVNSLQTEPIARDAADQRAGRAGREAPGTCQRLWSWMEQSAKPGRTLPEIQRADLAEALLAVHAFSLTAPEKFPWFEPPPPKRKESARLLLEQLGLIFPREPGELTDIGRTLQAVPAHPRLAVLMWRGAGNGCFSLTAWAAALISAKPLFAGQSNLKSIATERRSSAKRQARQEHLPLSDFSEQILLVQEAEHHDFSPDFCLRSGIHPGAAREISRAARDFQEMGKRLHWNLKDAENSELTFRKILLQAFPDRIARRLDFGTPNCELAYGKKAELSPESVLREEPLFLAAEIRNTSGKLQLSLCSGIQEEWLLDLFPDAWEEKNETVWDHQRLMVMRQQSLACLGLLLENKIIPEPDPERAGKMLAKILLEGKENIPNWEESADNWIQRATWISHLYPEQNLPPYNAEAKENILQTLCAGENSLKKLKGKDTLAYVKGFYNYAQQRFVEEMAPEFIRLPNGRKMKLHYTVGQPPKGSAKIYDLYDLPDLPTIAGGRARVLLDILAPNFRTVQITDDLANFWKELYPKIKPELARRYPKHPWR